MHKLAINISIITIYMSLSSLAFAGSYWVKMASHQKSCPATCGRIGMEGVTTGLKKGPWRDITVCATSIKGEQYPGINKLSSKRACQAIVANKSFTGNNSYCLCADDGTPKGADYNWIKRKFKASCPTTCKKTAPKYRYAVYAGHKSKWLNVCIATDGKIGFTTSELGQCTANAPGSTDEYGCLCTTSFAGDLDSQKDP